MTRHAGRTARTSGSRGAVAMLARHDARVRWRTIVVAAVLAGIVSGIGLACLAGARRTDSLFDRHLTASNASDLEIDPGTPTPAADAALRSIPEVTDASYWAVVSAFVLGEDGDIDPRYAGTINFTTDGRYLDQDRVAVRSGRRLDPTKPDEVMLNPYFAEVLHKRVGDTVDIGLAASDSDGVPTTMTPSSSVSARVVGIMEPTEDVIGAELDRFPKMFVSPAFGDLEHLASSDYVGYAWYGLTLRGGQADVDRVVAQWQVLADEHNATLPEDASDDDRWLTFVHRVGDLRRTAERAVRPMVAALVTFGALVLLGSVVLLSQALARSVRQGQDEIRVARMLGLTATPAAVASLVTPVLTGVGAVVVAVVTAVGLSSRFPAGPYRVLEPAPGRDADLVVLGLGALVLLAVPIGVAVWAARREARHDLLEQHTAIEQGSSIVGLVTRLGAPATVVSAVRLTVQPGRGRAFVPVRLVLVSSVLTVAIVVTTLVFGQNLHAVAQEPERFGWTPDALLMMDGGYGKMDPDTVPADMQELDQVDGWRLVGADRTSLEGRDTPGIVVGPAGGTGGDLEPVMVSGRAPSRAGEIVVGARTLREIGAEVGDTVTMGSGDAARPELVTGTAVFPELGPVLALRTRLDDGVWADPTEADAFATLTLFGPVYNVLLADLTPGASPQRFGADFARRLDGRPTTGTVDAFGVVRPVEVDTAAAAGRAQSALVGVVVVVAVLSLLLTLLAVVRRRRGDLAILSVLGFTPGQLRRVIMLQGVLFALVGVVLGVPLGIGLGRELWRRFAETLGVVVEPTMSWTVIGTAAIVVIVVGMLSAIGPAVAAGRSTGFHLDRE